MFSEFFEVDVKDRIAGNYLKNRFEEFLSQKQPIKIYSKKELKRLDSEKSVFIFNSQVIGVATKHFRKTNKVFFGQCGDRAIELIQEVRTKHKVLKLLSKRKDVINNLEAWIKLNDELLDLASKTTLLSEWEIHYS
ncbi:hypothetical protein B9T10_07300 [Wohlfahrtiimonas chitiniclastica]|uniref:hypothetical protein n=1 Tax=Wohlfahrtiimonas chitiniclastica TaxID=400946 RepID=UPI000B986208|nr:hypothetical protein [Wohlfahrtiimonas chitiniclastica]OYQ89095.1 hypothetical protein B9T10_07300 [Wohlfahrtiimonas chitiniclastica]